MKLRRSRKAASDEAPALPSPPDAEPASPPSEATPPAAPSRQREEYAGLLYDLFMSTLRSPDAAQSALRAVLKKVEAANRPGQGARYERYERPWVLRLACAQVRRLAPAHMTTLSPNQQIELDAAPDAETRLRSFDTYFQRLELDDQVVMLLHDKHAIPYPEIASALGVPEPSLKLAHSQALRTLEDWLWSNP